MMQARPIHNMPVVLLSRLLVLGTTGREVMEIVTTLMLFNAFSTRFVPAIINGD